MFRFILSSCTIFLSRRLDSSLYLERGDSLIVSELDSRRSGLVCFTLPGFPFWCFLNMITFAVEQRSRKLAVVFVLFFSCSISFNRPFARSGLMVRNKLCWDASYTVGLSKQRKVGPDWYEFLCFGSPTALFASQHNLFRTMWPDRAEGLFTLQEVFFHLVANNASLHCFVQWFY